MMAERESPLCQELGPKKFTEKVEKANKFYDNYKAGKRDPKTGEFYYHIHGKNPLLKTKLGRNDGCISCGGCEIGLGVTTSTAIVICTRCGTYHEIKRDRVTREIVEVVIRKRD